MTLVVRRAIVATIAVWCSMVLAPVAVHAVPVVLGATAPAKTPKPLKDPKHNTQPSQHFVDTCRSIRSSKADNDKCDAAALRDFDKVRKKEGLGRMTLPGDFDKLSVNAQLLAISNIERMDRGRRPVLARSKHLDKLALKGAKANEDPPFPNPFPGTDGSGNWAAAGNSALLDDFYWMYDDGPGSFNIDCPPSGGQGCWGHRHDILFDFDAPLVMGTAVAHKTQFGTSMTELFIGGDHKDKPNVKPTWHAIARSFPPKLAISVSATRVASGKAVTVTGKVTARVAHIALPGALVELQSRPGASGSWHAVTSRRTGPIGVVNFALHPRATASYRVIALGRHHAKEGASAAIRITIG